MEKENKVIEELNEEKQELTKEELVEKKEKKRKKRRKIRRIISDTIVIILFIVMLCEITIGMINMKKIDKKEKPIWYISKKVTVSEDQKSEIKTVYNLGLYKIVVTEPPANTNGEIKRTLVPFFY